VEQGAARDAVLDAVRRSLTQGGLPLRAPELHTAPTAGRRAAYVWRSRQAWLGPLVQSPERALLFAAVDVVGRIVVSAAWASPYLDDHRIRLDPALELDEIDDQALRLARLRHELGQPEPLPHGWPALVDRVAALELYAGRLLALESELARQAAADRAALLEMNAATLAAGAARDELATDHVRALADDLRHRTTGEITNSATSHRNAT
jgi:hypothetical protein